MSSAPSVTVSIARDPALVRTVRLIAAAVARRTGGDEDFVEEVRLAIGEACALLVGEDEQADPPTEPITVVMSIDDQLMVKVTAAEVAEPTIPAAGIEPWALLRGLIDDFEIVRNGATTTVSMSWPTVPGF